MNSKYNKEIEIKERNYGVDLLRIVSMLLVVLLHVMRQGGILNNVPMFSLKYAISWLLEILAFGAVNCYALTSGFVGINSSSKLRNLIQLWFQVFFYSFSITMIFLYLAPSLVDITSIFQAFFPMSSGVYWYFTAYFGLFLIIPMLNFVINNMDEKRTKTMLSIGFVLFSILPTFTFIDQFQLEAGYSMLWLIYLYLIGAYMQKYNVLERIHKNKCIYLFLGLSIITWLSKLIIDTMIAKFSIEIIRSTMLIEYISPTVLLGSVALFAFFAKLNLRKYKKIISSLSPLSFGVYLIHTQPLIWDNLFKDRFVFLSNKPIIQMFVGIFLSIIGVYTVCLMIEYARVQIFKYLKLKEYSIQMEKYILKKLK